MTLTIELPAELEAKLRAVAAQQGISVSELALSALEQLVTPRQESIEEMSSGEYLLHLAEKHSVAVPEEGRDALPPDYAKNYKHYLYGYPKEQE
jgi:predicted transcriptional regulator